MIKFNDIVYTRPDIQGAIAKLTELAQAQMQAETFEEALAIFDEVETAYATVATMYSIAHVRHTVDTTDKFYEAEITFLDESLPLLQNAYQAFNQSLLDSKFRPEFTQRFGELLFTKLEMQRKTFSPEIIPELQEENKLVTEYSKLIASAQIDFEGETLTLSQLTPYKVSNDDRLRRLAWEAEGKFYEQNGEKLDSLYDSLVKLRDKAANKLGYPNYTPLGYNRMSRESYNQEDVELFRKSVREHLVPVATKLYKAQAQRTGVDYPLSFADASLHFRSGNPKPQGSAEDILTHAHKFYQELSPETAEFIDALYGGEYYDVLSKKGKAGGGYCTFLPDYKTPFIFANFNGTSGDVDVMTHEAGHAFAFYMARGFYPSAYRQPTLESCEVHSMSMEFFAWDWIEGFFGADSDKYKYEHITSAITFIPYGTMVDHFQHIIYDNPEMSPAQRHAEWKKLLGIYMPWMKLGEVPFYGDGKGWQRQQHIYSYPFYYIDYCLAQTIALQCWVLMQSDRNKAWDKYLSFVKLGGTMTFRDLVTTSGFDLPFGDVFKGKLVETVMAWIDNFKQTVTLE